MELKHTKLFAILIRLLYFEKENQFLFEQISPV